MHVRYRWITVHIPKLDVRDELRAKDEFAEWQRGIAARKVGMHAYISTRLPLTSVLG